MKTKFISLLAIIFGLILIIFPMMNIIKITSLIGLSLLLMSIFLLVAGVSIIDYNKSGSILDLFLGIVLLLLSLLIIFDPAILSFIAEITIYLAGIMLIVMGLVSLINNRESKNGFYIGIAGIILGLIYIIIGTYITNVVILGSLIGMWLIICGALKLTDS